MFEPDPMPSQRPINTAQVRAAHKNCDPREIGICPDHDDIFALCDELDRLAMKLFAAELREGL